MSPERELKMNRKVSRLGDSSMKDTRKTFVPLREMGTIKNNTSSCRMSEPWERMGKRRLGIMKDFRVY